MHFHFGDLWWPNLERHRWCRLWWVDFSRSFFSVACTIYANTTCTTTTITITITSTARGCVTGPYGKCLIRHMPFWCWWWWTGGCTYHGGWAPFGSSYGTNHQPGLLLFDPAASYGMFWCISRIEWNQIWCISWIQIQAWVPALESLAPEKKQCVWTTCKLHPSFGNYQEGSFFHTIKNWCANPSANIVCKSPPHYHQSFDHPPPSTFWHHRHHCHQWKWRIYHHHLTPIMFLTNPIDTQIISTIISIRIISNITIIITVPHHHHWYHLWFFSDSLFFSPSLRSRCCSARSGTWFTTGCCSTHRSVSRTATNPCSKKGQIPLLTRSSNTRKTPAWHRQHQGSARLRPPHRATPRWWLRSIQMRQNCRKWECRRFTSFWTRAQITRMMIQWPSLYPPCTPRNEIRRWTKTTRHPPPPIRIRIRNLMRRRDNVWWTLLMYCAKCLVQNADITEYLQMWYMSKAKSFKECSTKITIIYILSHHNHPNKSYHHTPVLERRKFPRRSIFSWQSSHHNSDQTIISGNKPIMSEKHQVIIDTDPGIDDLAALTFALHHPNLEVLGLTICYGNVPLEHCTRNARHILSLCKKGSLIPVVPGAAKPLLREPRYTIFDFIT